MALSKEEILEAISEMSVMDIVDLISAMEEKFGVSAAAPQRHHLVKLKAQMKLKQHLEIYFWRK